MSSVEDLRSGEASGRPWVAVAGGRHPWNRLLAWLIDWASIMGWVAITAAIGVPVFLTGVTRSLSNVSLNVVAAVVMVVPVTLALARLESSSQQSTVGKRVRRLRVADSRTGVGVSFGRALVRNVAKIAVPWTIGHAAVYAIVTSGDSVPVWVWLLTALAYVLPVVYVVSLFVGGGRTPYDHLARTVVIDGSA